MTIRNMEKYGQYRRKRQCSIVKKVSNSNYIKTSNHNTNQTGS